MTGVTSTDRTFGHSPQLVATRSTGNVTFDTIDLSDYYSELIDRTPDFHARIYTTCFPPEGYGRTIDTHNVNISLRNPNNATNRFQIFVLGGTKDTPTKNIINMTNLYIHDVNNALFYPFAIVPAVIDEVHISDLVFDNVVVQTHAFVMAFALDLYVKNVTVRNTVGMDYAFIQFLTNTNIYVNGLTVTNFTGSNSPIDPLLKLNDGSNVYYEFREFTVMNSQLNGASVIYSTRTVEKFVLSDFTFSNVTISSGESIIKLDNIQHATISNYTITSVVNSDTVNDGSSVILISAMDLNSNYETEEISVSTNSQF